MSESTLPKDRCGWCKWMNQGEDGAICINPKQDNQSLIDYVYYPFTCGLQEAANRPNEEQMKELGYEKLLKPGKYYDGSDASYFYYKKIK